MMHGGFEPISTGALIKLVVIPLIVSGVGYLNWDVISTMAHNGDVACNGVMAQPEMKVTNWVLNIFGLGTNCLNNSLFNTLVVEYIGLGSLTKLIHLVYMFDTSVFTNNASSFVNWVSSYVVNFKLW